MIFKLCLPFGEDALVALSSYLCGAAYAYDFKLIARATLSPKRHVSPLLCVLVYSFRLALFWLADISIVFHFWNTYTYRCSSILFKPAHIAYHLQFYISSAIKLFIRFEMIIEYGVTSMLLMVINWSVCKRVFDIPNAIACVGWNFISNSWKFQETLKIFKFAYQSNCTSCSIFYACPFHGMH